MKRIIIILLLSLFYFAGCEKSQIVDADIPFDEYIVVQSELKSEALFKGVTFTRTLPPGTEYNIADAELKDVTAYIKINGMQVIPLHYTSNGVYKPLYELQIKSGSTYELFGERGGTKFYSSTVAPYKPVLGDISYNDQSHLFTIYVTPRINEVYGAIWYISSAQDMPVNYTTLSNPGAAGDSIAITTPELPEKYRSPGYNYTHYIRVYSYDQQYYQFHNSIKNNEPVNNVFLQGGGNISWNVKGDKVIGLFMGMAEGDLRYVF